MRLNLRMRQVFRLSIRVILFNRTRMYVHKSLIVKYLVGGCSDLMRHQGYYPIGTVASSFVRRGP